MNNKYSISSRAIHWLMAILIIAILAIGIYMTTFIAKDAPNRFEIYGLHKSLGVIALFFIFIRIFNRIISKTPKLPTSMPKVEINLSHLAHIGLYLLMAIVPISGYLMSNSFGYAVHLFSLDMPFLIEKNFELGKLFSTIHYYASYSLLALVMLHIAAVIKHRFFDKPEHDVLKRML